MDVIFFHGKPSSQENTAENLIGLESSISDYFFSGSTPNVPDYLFVQIYEYKQRAYSAYTYFHKGQDSSFRANGYFAITIIREGEIIKDIRSLYDFLKNDVYAGSVIDRHNIINRNGTYQVYSFSQRKPELNKITGEISERISHLWSQPIGTSFKTWNKSREVVTQNPADVSDRQLIEELTKNGCCCISSYILSKDGKKIQDLTASNDKLTKDNASLTERCERQDKQIQQQSKEIDNLRSNRNNARGNIPHHQNKSVALKHQYHEPEMTPPENDERDNTDNMKRLSDHTFLKGFRMADIIIIGLLLICCITSMSQCGGKRAKVVTEIQSVEKQDTMQHTDTTDPITSPVAPEVDKSESPSEQPSDTTDQKLFF